MNVRLAVAVLIGGVTVAVLAVHRSGAEPTKPAVKHVVAHTILSGKDVPRSVATIGDQPDHELVQRVYSYGTKSDDPDFDGMRTENVAQTDTIAGKGTHRGYSIWKNNHDDAFYVRFQGDLARSADG